tara:strand:- start:302 stop:1054 length:753 start_codon:yes stop_codon:yes gene_type:complete
MPDLTIKPNAGSGNKVIIQDQAGAAVLTTADSGATLGNSTQDNITRLGTVTTGTYNATIGSTATNNLAGGLRLITTATNTSGSVGSFYLADIFSATYMWYEIHLICWPSTDGGQLYCYPGGTAGSTFSQQASGKIDGSLTRHYTGNTTDTMDNNTGNDFWQMKYSDRNQEDHARHAKLIFHDPYSTGTRTQLWGHMIWGHGSNTTQSLFGTFGGSIRDAGRTCGLKFNYHTGNISYKVAVYGQVGSAVGI